MVDYFGKNADVLAKKKLFLFDMDGTVYLDETLFDGVPQLLQKIENEGGRYVFITNNASRSVKDYVAKMHRLGLTHIREEHFFTSAQAAFDILKEKFANDLIYVQATRSLVEEYKALGLRVTTEYTDEANAILVGFDPEFTGDKIYTTCKMLTKHDLPYYATNPDWVCPVEFGYIPDCGSMCQSLERATGKKPIFIGKPQPQMIYTVMKKFGFTAAETVVIGDRLYTDIASGNNAGVDTVCVLSGEVTLAEIEKATGSEVPTFVLESVKNMLDC
ncbi:MAG: HAD-IIA family hydrolase [Clostridia bacterium]|nr:HAD-IIA family hydrolase [Clostridia bacterium]